MSKHFIKLIIKYFSYIPDIIFHIFPKENLIKVKTLFDITQYKVDYYGSSLNNFIFLLLSDIYEILKEVKKILLKEKVITIISTLDIYEYGSKEGYTHSLFESNKLYTNENFSEWPINLLFDIINKLELYNSFNKISLTIKIKEINKL